MTTKTTPDFRGYDHEDYADWPEYQEMAAAINAFACRLDQERAAVPQLDFERLLADISRHVCLADRCENPDCPAFIVPPYAHIHTTNYYAHCGNRWRRHHNITRAEHLRMTG